MPDMDSITDNGAPCLPKERHVMLAYMSILLYLILYLHIYITASFITVSL